MSRRQLVAAGMAGSALALLGAVVALLLGLTVVTASVVVVVVAVLAGMMCVDLDEPAARARAGGRA